MENSSYIKPYFYIDDERVIYPASIWKRFGARFIDILLVNILISLIFAIIYSDIGNYGIPSDTVGDEYATYVPQLYSWQFMLINSLGIICLVSFNLLIPLFNRSYPGQTFGKHLFGIAPIFFSPSSKKRIATREVPLTLVIIIPPVILLVMGGNPNFYYHQAQTFVKNGGIIGSWKPDGEEELTIFIFVTEYMTNPEIMPNGIALTKSAAFFIYLKQVFTGIYWIFLIVLFVSIAFNHQKMGLMDKLANTSVVDLKTIIQRSLIEGDPNYVPDNHLEPKDAPSDDGPPIELNK